jgi:hypothetical protein
MYNIDKAGSQYSKDSSTKETGSIVGKLKISPSKRREQITGIPHTPMTVIKPAKKAPPVKKNDQYSIDSGNSVPLEIMKGIEIKPKHLETTIEIEPEAQGLKKDGSTPRFHLNKKPDCDDTPNIKRTLFDNEEDSHSHIMGFAGTGTAGKKEIDMQTGFSFKNKEREVSGEISGSSFHQRNNYNNEKASINNEVGNDQFNKTFGRLVYENKDPSANNKRSMARNEMLGGKQRMSINMQETPGKNNIPVNNSTNLSSWNKGMAQSNVANPVTMHSRYNNNVCLSKNGSMKSIDPKGDQYLLRSSIEQIPNFGSKRETSFGSIDKKNCQDSMLRTEVSTQRQSNGFSNKMKRIYGMKKSLATRDSKDTNKTESVGEPQQKFIETEPLGRNMNCPRAGGKIPVKNNTVGMANSNDQFGYNKKP